MLEQARELRAWFGHDRSRRWILNAPRMVAAGSGVVVVARRRSPALGRHEAGNDLAKVRGNRSRHLTLRTRPDQRARRRPCIDPGCVQFG